MNCPICNEPTIFLGQKDVYKKLYRCSQHGNIEVVQDEWTEFRRETAKAVLQGLIARTTTIRVNENATKEYADISVMYADALIEELKQRENQIVKRL